MSKRRRHGDRKLSATRQQHESIQELAGAQHFSRTAAAMQGGDRLYAFVQVDDIDRRVARLLFLAEIPDRFWPHFIPFGAMIMTLMREVTEERRLALLPICEEGTNLMLRQHLASAGGRLMEVGWTAAGIAAKMVRFLAWPAAAPSAAPAG